MTIKEETNPELKFTNWLIHNYQGVMDDFEEISNPDLDFEQFARDYYNDIFNSDWTSKQQ